MNVFISKWWFHRVCCLPPIWKSKSLILHCFISVQPGCMGMYRDSMLLFPFKTLCICCKNGGCQPNVQPRLLSISRVGDSNDGLDSLNAGVAAGD